MYEEEYQEEEYQEELPEFVAERQIDQSQARLSYSQAYGGYLPSTKAEGEIGEKLEQLEKKSRLSNDKEIFINNMLQFKTTIEEHSELAGYADTVLELIDRIPDVKYKSILGCVFGYIVYRNKLIGHKLDAKQHQDITKIISTYLDEKRKLENLRGLKQSMEIKDIYSLDVVRYARAWTEWLS